MSVTIFDPSLVVNGSSDGGGGGASTIGDVTGLQTALDGKESTANKATSLELPDNKKYPTTLAVATALAGVGGGDLSSQGKQVGRYITGLFYDNALAGVNNSIINYTSTPDGVLRSPFTSADDFTIDQIGAYYSTNNGSIKFAILSANPVTGWPDQVLWEGSSQTTTAAGFKASTINPALTLAAGATYWLQVRTSVAGVLAMLVSGFPCFSALPNQGGQNSQRGMLKTTETYANPTAPAYVGNTNPSVADMLPNAIRFVMRAA